MNHTEVVNLVRAAPKVVDLVVGRVLEPPKPPIEAHLLPDIMFQCHDESLGNGNINVYMITDPLYHSRPSVFSEIPRILLGEWILQHSTLLCGAFVLSDCQRSTELYWVTRKHRYHQNKQSPPAFHWKNELMGLDNTPDKGVRFQPADKKAKERKTEGGVRVSAAKSLFSGRPLQGLF